MQTNSYISETVVFLVVLNTLAQKNHEPCALLRFVSSDL